MSIRCYYSFCRPLEIIHFKYVFQLALKLEFGFLILWINECLYVLDEMWVIEANNMDVFFIICQTYANTMQYGVTSSLDLLVRSNELICVFEADFNNRG